MRPIKIQLAAIAAAILLTVTASAVHAQANGPASAFQVQTVNAGSTGMPNNPGSLTGFTKSIGNPPPACNPADQPAEQAKCQKAEQCRVLKQELAELMNNGAILRTVSQQLTNNMAAIDKEIARLLGTTDNFTLRLVSACAKNALEARTLGINVNKVGAACAQGAFGYRCVVEGAATAKEVTKYLWQNKEVRAALLTVTQQTATFAWKTAQGQEPWHYHLPIWGNACRANIWGKEIFSAADLIEELGMSRRNLQRANFQIMQLIQANDLKIKAVQAELTRLGC